MAVGHEKTWFCLSCQIPKGQLHQRARLSSYQIETPVAVAMSRILQRFLPLQRHCHHQAGGVVKQGKIYELRTYNLWPQHVKDFLGLTVEEFHLRTSQSKLVGYWTSELGGLNQTFHIWEYDDLEHRAQVRARLATDTAWNQRYFSKILPWMSSQQNCVSHVIPGIDLAFPLAEKGFYQLQTFILKGEPDSMACFKESAFMNSDSTALLIGAFKTLMGNLNEINLLWQYPSLTAASHHVKEQTKDGKMFDNIISGYSKVMVPFKVSPLQ